MGNNLDFSARPCTSSISSAEEQENRASSSGKMSPVHSAATKGVIFESCLKKSERPTFQCLIMENGQMQAWQNCRTVKLPGASLTLNTSVSPNVAIESSLSQILQDTDALPSKYYLSRKACENLLRRAENLGKTLPRELEQNLQKQMRHQT